MNQADIVGLLSFGSKANPRDNTLEIGEAGENHLVQVKQEGKDKGLAAYFEKERSGAKSIIGANGLPPFPSGMSQKSLVGGRKYVMDADRAEGYPEE